MIGDLRTVALVGTDGTIDWCCLPRFDSPSVFGAILDADRGGCFALSACDTERVRQLYLPDSNVLMTRFLGIETVGEVVDFMVPHDPKPTQQHMHPLVRRATAVKGTVTFEMRCEPAFDYGRATHETTRLEHGVLFTSPVGTLTLRSSVPIQIDGPAAVARVTLGQTESADFVLEWEGERRPLASGEVDDMFARTNEFWKRWIHRSRYQGRWREMVHRSALALKLLVYQPSGALVAAPTTSLPENIGGTRNWDYRYAWLRDAAFTIYALIRLGFTSEAEAFMSWLEARCREADEGEGLRVVYGIDGARDLHEIELDHLEGYRGSRPVRIGNGAAGQLQLDVLGEVMDSVYLYNKYGEPISYDLWAALDRQLAWLEKHWDEADDGIWEVRGARKRFTYSRVMVWVAFERAMRIARDRGLPAPMQRWASMKDMAYMQVQGDGWDEQQGAFVQAYGSSRLDASLLIMPLVKFVGPTDPRFLSTLDRVAAELVSDTLVRRYETHDGADGLSEPEGTFNLCSFWFVEALTRAGRLAQAQLVFEKMLTYANHVGLYAEEIGPAGEAAGNFPQAFTHLALISAAFNLDRALNR